MPSKVYFAKGRYFHDGEPRESWFIQGTRCELVADCESFGIFSGFRQSEAGGENHPFNDVYEDEEGCTWDEFWEFTIEEGHA